MLWISFHRTDERTNGDLLLLGSCRSQKYLNADINAVYSSINVCFKVEDIVIHPVIAAFINEKVGDDIDM